MMRFQGSAQVKCDLQTRESVQCSFIVLTHLLLVGHGIKTLRSKCRYFHFTKHFHMRLCVLLFCPLDLRIRCMDNCMCQEILDKARSEILIPTLTEYQGQCGKIDMFPNI